MGHGARDWRTRGRQLARVCLLVLPAAQPCSIELSVEGTKCGTVPFIAELDSTEYCEALCGGDSCVRSPQPQSGIPENLLLPSPPRPLAEPLACLYPRRFCRFDRGACVPTVGNEDWVKSTIDVAVLVDGSLSKSVDSFMQVGGADTACRSRPYSVSDDDYYDRYFTDDHFLPELYQNRLGCEELCLNDEECKGYEFRETGTQRGANSVWHGICETWRVGPVFESTTDGPRVRAGGTEAPATGYSCWQKLPGGRVTSTKISSCPLSILSLGLYTVGCCAALLVMVCCVCQMQKKRVGDITIDQSGFVPQANVDPMTPTAHLSPAQVGALRNEREQLEAALGVSPGGIGGPEPPSRSEMESLLDAAAMEQPGGCGGGADPNQEMRLALPPQGPRQGPLSPLAMGPGGRMPQPPPSPRPAELVR